MESETGLLKVERKALAHISVSSVGTILLAWYCLSRPLSAARALGLGLAIFAFALWATARLQIGTSFSVQPKAKVLVTHGIYSRIRNPIYIFGMLWIMGLILAIGEPWLLLILLVLVPMQVLRAKREASVLEAKFGDQYRAYHRRTWF